MWRLHRTPLESVIDAPLSAITLLSHAPTPPHPHLRPALGRGDRLRWAGQVCLCAIFGFFVRVADYFSFPNIPNDFLFKCKIMQRVCRNGGGVGRRRDKRFGAHRRVKYFCSLSKPRYYTHT